MKPTEKELRALSVFLKMENSSILEDLKEYQLLIDTLFYLNESLKDEKIPIKYWEVDRETLLIKFCLHGLSIHKILSGHKLESIYFNETINGKIIIDISSARAVLRSQLEAFLMFHYIYINPDNDLKELRYNAWIYSSLMQRQIYPAKTEVGKTQKQNDLIDLDRMRENIKNLKSFKNLTKNQQKGLLDSGTGKLFNTWSDILKETGFDKNHHFNFLYGFLSIYVHSEGLSMIQLSPESGRDINYTQLARLELRNSKLLICHLITSLNDLNKAIYDRFCKLPNHLRYDIEIYSQMSTDWKTSCP